jgi:hypothetical protein
VFEYIEMFYNPKRKHTNDGMLSPIHHETRQHKLNKAGVKKTRGISNVLIAGKNREKMSTKVSIRSFDPVAN